MENIVKSKMGFNIFFVKVTHILERIDYTVIMAT